MAGERKSEVRLDRQGGRRRTARAMAYAEQAQETPLIQGRGYFIVQTPLSSG